MSGHIINDFKDLRSLIGEVTKANPAKTTYQQNAQKMGVMKEAPEAKPKDDKGDRGIARSLGKKHAGEEEIKKAYLKLGRAAQGSVEYQKKLIQKELAKMGYKTYSMYAFDQLFKFENAQLESALSDMRNIVKTKGARKINGIMVDMFTASVITQAYDKVNDANKKKMEKANLQTLVKLAHKIMGMKEEFTLNESKMGDLLIDIQMGATAKELARDHNITLAAAKSFLSDYYGNKKTRKAPGLKKEYAVLDTGLDKALKKFKVKFSKDLKNVDEGKMKDIIMDFEAGVSDAKIAKLYNVSIQVIKGLRKDWKSMGEENLKERVGMKLRQIKSKYKKQIADFQRGKDLDYDAELALLAYAYDKGLVSSDDADEVDDWLMTNVADKRAFNKLKEDVQERFGVNLPSGKKLKDFEVFLDSKEIEKALKIVSTQLKKDGISFNPMMKNLKSAPSGKDVIINAVDEGDRWRLMVMGQERGKNFKELDISSSFEQIQKLPSAKFKNMFAEGTWALPKTSKQKKELKDLMKKPIKLGKNGDDASDVISNLIGDDSLLDDIYTAGKKNPNGDAREVIKKHMKRLGIREETREDKLKEQKEHAKQSPFKLKSQAYPRAVAINTDGFGNRHATVEDIIAACDSFGMILDKELQVEQVQKELGKNGFISFKQTDLEDVFHERETQRVILALESTVEEQKPTEYTRDEVEDAYIMGEEIEFLKPDGLKAAGKILKLSGNTYNVKDKFTGKSYTYKYIGETEVKTFNQVMTEGRFPKKLVKMAMGIVWDKRYAGGNMTGAVTAIEKLKKGLSDEPEVRNALRLANEGIDKWIPEGGDKESYQKFFMKALKKFGVNSPDELEGEKKKEFFDYVDKNWKGDHEEKDANPSDHKIDGRRKNFREKMRKLGYIKGN